MKPASLPNFTEKAKMKCVHTPWSKTFFQRATSSDRRRFRCLQNFKFSRLSGAYRGLD